MRAVVIILMLLIAILESDIRTTVTLALTVLWLIYTIYVCIKLLKAKDKKIEIKKQLHLKFYIQIVNIMLLLVNKKIIY